MKTSVTPTCTWTQKYAGWKLADQEFQAYVDPKKARVVFYIMVAGLQELPGLDALLRNVYDVDHFFLVHLDVKVCLVRLCLLYVC